MKKTLIIALSLLLFISTMSCTEEKNEEKPKDSLVDLVLIPSGTFQMGNTGKYEDVFTEDEKPVHTVRISNSFYMSKYEITQKQYEAVMGENPSHFSGSNLPVEKVSWYDAVEFCNKLSEKEGLTPCYTINGENVTCNWNANGYRLPTEAEWEYAAKGGTETDFYSGNLTNATCEPIDANLNRIGWYCGNSESRTHPVGEKEPNSYGLYDMSGNVWEWCWDWHNEYNSAPEITDNPKGPTTGVYRVLRGGSWYSYASFCRSSFRNHGYYVPDHATYHYGFRIVRTN